MQSEVSSLGDRVEVISLTRRESCREVHVLQGGGGKGVAVLLVQPSP